MGGECLTQIIGRVGFKNIFLFGKSLATKKLWRGMFGCGLSTSIINEKYIKEYFSDRMDCNVS